MRKSSIIPIGLLSSLSLISPSPDLLSTFLYSEALSGYVDLSGLIWENIVYAAWSTTLVQRKTITYNVPGSAAQVEFVLWYDASGVISSISTNKINGDSTSAIFINLFIGKIGPTVIGKNLKSLGGIGAVWWASLTTVAFQQFLAGISLPAPVASSAPAKVTPPVSAKPVNIPPVPVKSTTLPAQTISVPSGQTVIAYMTPGGGAKIWFTLTRDAVWIIRTIATVPLSWDQTSYSYMLAFTRAISGNIIGKKVTELSLSSVAGASLTTSAFNKYLTTLPQIQSATPAVVTTTIPVKQLVRLVLSPVKYKNLTYTVPGGISTVRFAFRTDATGKIRSIQARNILVNDPTTAGYIRAFWVQIGRLAMGKKPSELGHLSAIGGASLTTGAFKKFASAMAEWKLDTLESDVIVIPTTKPIVPPTSTGANDTATQTISYTVPGSTAQVSFTLVRNTAGLIQSVTTSKVSGDAMSTAYIQMFASSISAATVGKNITGLSLSAIGGASLTTGAFNQFVASLGWVVVPPPVVPPVTSPVPPTAPIITVTSGTNQISEQNVTYTVPWASTQVHFYLSRNSAGVIQSVSANKVTGDATSILYIQMFANSISAATVGKSINNLSLASIGGASLTTNAFNQFINSIGGSAVTPVVTPPVAPTTPTTPTIPVVIPPATVVTTPTTSTNTQTISYTVPGSTAQVSFTLVRNTAGLIQSVTTSKVSGDATSTAYIQMFASSISAATVGKNITGLSLSAIGGASLTTWAFNQFITAIGGSIVAPVTTTPTTPAPVVTTPTTPTTPVVTTPVGANQTAQQSIIYSVPGGTAQAQFTLVYDTQGVAQSISAITIAGNTESKTFITKFANSIATSVVGKAISSIPTLSRIGGASLTTWAFNQFIASIKPTIITPTTPTTPVTTTPTTPVTTTPTTPVTTTPTIFTLNIANGGIFATTTASLRVGDSINFIYTGTAEAIVQFTPSSVSGFTLDKDITQKTRLFSTAGTWTAKIKDYSGNILTITVQ
jgi:hypothetical protein